MSPSPVPPQINIEAESLNSEAANKEQEYVHKIALNRKLNIKNSELFSKDYLFVIVTVR